MATNQPPPNYGFSDQPGAPQGYPGGAPMAPPQGNGMAVAGLVLGIIALVLSWTTWPAWLLGILGIIFGALGISKANKIGGKGKGMAIAGLVCSIVGIIIGVIVFVLVLRAVKNFDREFEREWKRKGELNVQPDTRTQADRTMPAPLPFV